MALYSRKDAYFEQSNWPRRGKTINEEHPENPKAWHYRPYGPEDTVELASLGIQLKMDDIYQDLDFDEEEDEQEQ